MRLDLALEVVAVLDDAREDERTPGRRGGLDRLGGALVRMDPPEREQVPSRAAPDFEPLHLDAVMDRRGVAEGSGAGRRR